MSETASQAIIHDLFVLCGMALVMALGVYAMLRAGEGPIWNYEGEVLSRPYGWGDGLTALILLTFFAWGSLAANQMPATPPGQTGETSISALMVGMVFMLMIAAVLLAYLRVRGLNPGELFGMRQLTIKAALFSAAGWLVLVYVVMVLSRHFLEKNIFGGSWPDDSEQDPVKTFQQAGGPALKLLLAAGAVIIAPIAEETIFRGFIYGVVKSFSERWFAAIFTSLVFAAVHQHVGSLPALFVLAMGFAMAYEATGCLLVPMFMHALFNALNLALLASGHS